MKETKIMKTFEQYIKKYDMNKGNVKAIYLHSIKMMELCKDIAASLKTFTEEEIIICGFIGLFHNIGMISNKTKECISLDNNTELAKKTIEILFDKEKLIRKITDDITYDEVIKVAIYCQDKNGLPNNLPEKPKAFCKVLKDANTIEKFRMINNYPHPYIDMYIESYPSDNIYEEFKNFQVMTINKKENNSDTILEVLSLVFNIYYPYSYKIIKQEQSVNKLIENLIINNKTIAKFFLQIASVLNMYIEKKISS